MNLKLEVNWNWDNVEHGALCRSSWRKRRRRRWRGNTCAGCDAPLLLLRGQLLQLLGHCHTCSALTLLTHCHIYCWGIARLLDNWDSICWLQTLARKMPGEWWVCDTVNFWWLRGGEGQLNTVNNVKWRWRSKYKKQFWIDMFQKRGTLFKWFWFFWCLPLSH